MSIKSRMEKSIVEHLYCEHDTTAKNHELPLQTATWLKLRNMLEQKKPDRKEHIPYDSVFIKFKKQTK